MDLDDINIYDDLDNFHEDENKRSKELLAWETKYNGALKSIEQMNVENKNLEKKIKRIAVNFQSLLDTAKAEIKRKDTLIAQLRKEKDDICFRRRVFQTKAGDDGVVPVNGTERDISDAPQNNIVNNVNRYERTLKYQGKLQGDEKQMNSHDVNAEQTSYMRSEKNRIDSKQHKSERRNKIDTYFRQTQANSKELDTELLHRHDSHRNYFAEDQNCRTKEWKKSMKNSKTAEHNVEDESEHRYSSKRKSHDGKKSRKRSRSRSKDRHRNAKNHRSSKSEKRRDRSKERQDSYSINAKRCKKMTDNTKGIVQAVKVESDEEKQHSSCFEIAPNSSPQNSFIVGSCSDSLAKMNSEIDARMPGEPAHVLDNKNAQILLITEEIIKPLPQIIDDDDIINQKIVKEANGNSVEKVFPLPLSNSHKDIDHQSVDMIIDPCINGDNNLGSSVGDNDWDLVDEVICGDLATTPIAKDYDRVSIKPLLSSEINRIENNGHSLKDTESVICEVNPIVRETFLEEDRCVKSANSVKTDETTFKLTENQSTPESVAITNNNELIKVPTIDFIFPQNNEPVKSHKCPQKDVPIINQICNSNETEQNNIDYKSSIALEEKLHESTVLVEKLHESKQPLYPEHMNNSSEPFNEIADLDSSNMAAKSTLIDSDPLEQSLTCLTNSNNETSVKKYDQTREEKLSFDVTTENNNNNRGQSRKSEELLRILNLSSESAFDRDLLNDVNNENVKLRNPLQITVNYDEKYNELDLRMSSMFESPQKQNIDTISKNTISKNTDEMTLDIGESIEIPNTTQSIENKLQIDIAAQHNDSNAKIDEHSEENVSKENHSTETTIKCLSLGTSHYRFVQVNEHETKLFITRRKKNKIKKLTEPNETSVLT